MKRHPSWSPGSDDRLAPIVFTYLMAVHRLYLKRQRDEEERLARMPRDTEEG
jgi:hypothetical protein